MKKAIILGLTLAVLGLTACTPSNKEETSTKALAENKPNIDYLGFDISISCEDEWNKIVRSDLYSSSIGGTWDYDSLTGYVKDGIKDLWYTAPLGELDDPKRAPEPNRRISWNPMLVKAQHVRNNVEVNGYYILTPYKTFGVVSKYDDPAKYYWISYKGTNEKDTFASGSEFEVWKKNVWEFKGDEYSYIIKDGYVDEKTTRTSYRPGISVLFYPMMKDNSMIIYSKEFDNGGKLSKWELGSNRQLGNTFHYGTYGKEITRIEFRNEEGNAKELDYYTIYQNRDSDKKDDIREGVRSFLFPEGAPTDGEEFERKEKFFENANNIIEAFGTYDFVEINY